MAAIPYVNGDFCEALGLDPSEVISLTIHVAANEIPTVLIERVIDGKTAHTLRNLLARFQTEPAPHNSEPSERVTNSIHIAEDGKVYSVTEKDGFAHYEPLADEPLIPPVAPPT